MPKTTDDRIAYVEQLRAGHGLQDEIDLTNRLDNLKALMLANNHEEQCYVGLIEHMSALSMFNLDIYRHFGPELYSEYQKILADIYAYHITKLCTPDSKEAN